jgi:hypothetical protein
MKEKIEQLEQLFSLATYDTPISKIIDTIENLLVWYTSERIPPIEGGRISTTVFGDDNNYYYYVDIPSESGGWWMYLKGKTGEVVKREPRKWKYMEPGFNLKPQN